MKKFEGRTVMVTGAGKNIGKEIALSFAAEGANVIVCDYNRENAEQTALEIEGMGVSAMAAVCDVRDRKAIFAYAEEGIRRFGKIDILVNNAGGSADLLKKLSRFVDAEPETLDFVLDTNIKGTMNCTQAVLKSMIKEKYGKIINISSIAAVCGLYDRVDYAAAKAAQIGMTKALAMEVGEYNICVNCVSPGSVAEKGSDRMKDFSFVGRAGSYEEIANVILFVASDEASYVSGQNYLVDGCRKRM